MKVLGSSVVFDEFIRFIPERAVQSLKSHIAGPKARLARYPHERAQCQLGTYQHALNQTYNWPNKQPHDIIDLSSFELFIEDGLLRYFQDLKSAGDTISVVTGFKNRIVTSNVRGWKANGTSYPRLTALKDRDVKVGDIVHLKDGPNELWTSVAGFVADPVAAVINPAVSDSENQISRPNSNPGSAPTVDPVGGGSSGGNLQAGTYHIRYSFVGPFGETWGSPATSFTISAGNIPRVTLPTLAPGASAIRIYLSPPGGGANDCTLYATGITSTTYDLNNAYVSGGSPFIREIIQSVGPINGVSATAVNSANYKGTPSGHVEETYTIVVTQGSTGGDLTTAKLQVISASGTDNANNVTPSASGNPTNIGSRGLTVTWTRTADEFVVGQTWVVAVAQEFVAPTPTSSGSYSGSTDVTYVVTVTRGGAYTDTLKPQITVSTIEGIDQSGPTDVTAANTPVSIGTKGVQIEFNQTELCRGDIYFVSVVGPKEGAFRTIVLKNNLPPALENATDLDISLFIKDTIRVSRERVSDPPNINWAINQNTITVYAGITAYHRELTDNGVLFAVPVIGGTLFAAHRAWTKAFSASINGVKTPEEAVALFGSNALTPDDPLAYAVYQAVSNSNGREVKFTAIHNPEDLVEWDECLKILEGLHDVFTLVPLTRNPDVWTLYKNHVLNRADSDAIGGEWRRALFSVATPDEIAIVDQTKTTDSQIALATLTDDPDVAGTQYTLLTCTTANSGFVTNGVMPGDIVRYLYGINAFGQTVYQQFIVSEVVNEDTLILAQGHTAAVTTPQKVEIWRKLTKNQVADQLVNIVNTNGRHSRLIYMWPDAIDDAFGNKNVPGYFLCAAYAGYVSGIAPQQGLRNLQIATFTAAPRSTLYFNNRQLNTLSDSGIFVVTATDSGEVYCRAAVTSDVSDVDKREEVMGRIDDAFRYILFDSVAGYFGVATTSDSTLAMLSAELKAAGQFAVSGTRIDRIGPLVLSADIDQPARHPVQKDKLVVNATITRSYPINKVALTIIIGE